MSDSTVAEVLDRAAALVEPEGAWTQGANARTASGFPVNHWNDSAVCWCAFGAISYAAEDGEDDMSAITMAAMDVVRTIIGGGSLSIWNDDANRTQSEVVTTLRRAAQAARETRLEEQP